MLSSSFNSFWRSDKPKPILPNSLSSNETFKHVGLACEFKLRFFKYGPPCFLYALSKSCDRSFKKSKISTKLDLPAAQDPINRLDLLNSTDTSLKVLKFFWLGFYIF